MGTIAANPEGGDICSIDEPTLCATEAADFNKVTEIFSPFCNVFSRGGDRLIQLHFLG